MVKLGLGKNVIDKQSGRTFSGTGILEYADGLEIPCEFRLVRRVNEPLMLTCEHSRSGNVFAELYAGAPSPVRFRGQTQDQYALLVEAGMTLKSATTTSADRATVVYRCASTRLQVAGLDWEQPATVSFLLTNLIFEGDKPRLSSRGRRLAERQLDLVLAGRAVTLVQLAKYSDRTARLEADGGNIITAKAGGCPSSC